MSADANDGTFQQFSLTNNGMILGEDRTTDCVIFYIRNVICNCTTTVRIWITEKFGIQMVKVIMLAECSAIQIMIWRKNKNSVFQSLQARTGGFRNKRQTF